MESNRIGEGMTNAYRAVPADPSRELLSLSERVEEEALHDISLVNRVADRGISVSGNFPEGPAEKAGREFKRLFR